MKKKLGTVLVIFITIGCIFLGFNTRKVNAINVTQISTINQESQSYMVETNKHNIIMIDGGTAEDSEHLEKTLLEKGGVVDSWFITNAYLENFGAMREILKNGKIQINNIYTSFNSSDWYEENEPEVYPEILDFLDLLYSENIVTKVKDVPLKHEILLDNLYISVLNVKNPEFTGQYAGYNQSMIIKVNNTYKSMIFMGNIAQDGADKFKDNNLDEIDCDAVALSINGAENVSNEIYSKMSPEYIFMPKKDVNNYAQNLAQELKVQNVVVNTNDEDVTINIW